MTDAIPRLRFNTRLINKDIPIREVIARYTGISVPQSNKNIKCPSVRHNDNKPSAHIYGNNCKCFGCGMNFSPLTLAKEQYPELSFADVCERLLDDFGLDVYNYSNKAEVEAARRAKKENKFYDCFPLTEEELNFIGLQNPQYNEEQVYPVKISEYFAFFFGEIPPDIEVYEDGKEKLIELTENEAIQMGLIPENIGILKSNVAFPTLQQLWKQDKDGIEEMIIGKCGEAIEGIDFATKAVKQAVEQYQSSHSNAELKKTERICSEYVEIVANGGNVRLLDEQKDSIRDFFEFSQRKNVELPTLNEDKKYVEKILDKVLEQQRRRAKWVLQKQKTEKMKAKAGWDR